MAALPPVPETTPIVGSGGRVESNWLRWLNGVKQRIEDAVTTGGLGTIDASQIVSGTVALARLAGITNAQIADAAAIAWSKISKTGSSLADLTTRSASDLTSGLLALARGGTGADLSATGGSGQYVKQASAGAVLTVGTIPAGDLPTAIDAAKIADGSVSNTEYQYLDGAVSNVQQQINNKAPNQLARRSMSFLPALPVSTFMGIGSSAVITVAGTITHLTEADFIGKRCTSAAVIGNSGGFFTTQQFEATIADPVAWFRIRTGSDISNVRIWVGLANQNLANQDSSATTNIAAFRYSTVAGDGGWVGVTQAATANFTVSSTVAAIAASTEYLLRIRVSGDGTAIHFSVDGGTEQTITTDLPTTTVALNAVVKVTTQAASARVIDFAVLHVEFGAMARNVGNPV
jgi:hypothetical protein